MSAQNFNDLAQHNGHNIEVVIYAEQNASVECVDCYEVLLDYEKERASK